MEYKIAKSILAGEIRIPASKSHTIRGLIISSLAGGKSALRFPLESLDTLACVDACRLFGAKIETSPEVWTVEGNGGSVAVPDNVVDVKNSGTTLYVALGTGALSSGYVVFNGDDQIRKRPATNLLSSLTDLGATAFSTRNNGCSPIVVKGRMSGGTTSIACPTSQYLSSLLINCPLAQGDSTINVVSLNEKPYVQITLDWLASQGIRLEAKGMESFRIPGGQSYKAFDRKIPADFSSATFFLCEIEAHAPRTRHERRSGRQGSRIDIEENGLHRV
jgi:3-phosphoshikimate 1-carboxyvinyltransferase